MKAILSIIACAILVFTSSCGQAQNNASDKQIMAMLKEFYIAYNTAWSHSPQPSPKVLLKKLDSLQVKYCSIKLRGEMKEQFKKAGLDHDPLIGDVYTDVDHLNTLKITKDLMKENVYSVSYLASEASPFNKDETSTQQVTLHVTVIKEGESYKIDSVE